MQNEAIKHDLLSRLRNVRGHIAGVEKMIENEQPCSNVLMQLSAIRASVDKIGLHLLENNAIECLCEQNTAPEEKERVQKVVKQMLTFLK